MRIKGEQNGEQSSQEDGSANPQKSRSWNRRNLLKLIGMGAVGSAPLVLLPPILQKGAQEEPAEAQRQPAKGPSGRNRQWTMIIDLRRCDGCQSQGTPPKCTTACVEAHFAPEPMQWIEVFEQELPGGGTQFIPTPCQMCQNPPCVNVCPVAATFSTPEGTVLIDQERCIGCRICMAACPYDRRFFNWGDAPIPPEALLCDYSPEHEVHARKGTVMKCDFCPDLPRAGALPHCIQGCPQGAMYYGDLEEDLATNGEEVVSASRFISENNAFHLKEEKGTKPRVFYIQGHGEDVGRDSSNEGRLPTEWPWAERAKGSKTWKR